MAERGSRKRWVWAAVAAAAALSGAVYGLMWLSRPGRAKEEQLRRWMARDQMRRLVVALESYRNDNGIYPTTEQGLDALLRRPIVAPLPKNYFREGYIDRLNVPNDPWGRAFLYASPERDRPFSLRSRGRFAWYPGDDLVYREEQRAAGPGSR